METEDRRRATELLAALADGSRASIDPLYAALWPPVRAFCRRALGSDADGDDVAQDALVKLFARASEFDRDRDAMSFALGIAAWECRTHRRKVGRRREAEPSSEVPDPRTPEASLAEAELHAAAIEALGGLSASDTRTILAAINDDMSLRAGVTPTTFRKRLERALARLRVAWRSRHGAL